MEASGVVVTSDQYFDVPVRSKNSEPARLKFHGIPVVGAGPFTDLFTLLKVDGKWKIMNKVFHLHA